MLKFSSASVRMVNSRRASAECIESALGVEYSPDCRLIVYHASMGHDFAAISEEFRIRAPNATVVGSSCCGVVGREGVSESLKDIAIMTVKGEEEFLASAHVDGINGSNSFDQSKRLAESLQIASGTANIRFILFLAPGIDINTDACLDGFAAVFGSDVTVFGATSADNMQGLLNYQIYQSKVMEHGAWAVGFADPSLDVVTQASHGFVPIGDPMVVTAASGIEIHELNGKPAWQEFTNRLGLDPGANCGQSIPAGALAEELPPEVAKEYGNSHILRVVTKRLENGTMFYPTGCPVGQQLWLTERDEKLIFDKQKEMMKEISCRIGNDSVVAVFHADCLARGRSLFRRILKEELVGLMQEPLSTDDVIPPWLGMYGFGEFARLGGKNAFHNYTTALYALTRSSCDGGVKGESC